MADDLRDRQISAFLDRFVSEMPIPAAAPPAVIHRARRRLVITGVAAAVALIVTVAAATAVLRAVTDANRVVPATMGPAIPTETGSYLFDLETRQWMPVPDIVPRRYNSLGFATVSSDAKVASVGIGTHGRQVMFVGNIDGTNVRALAKTPASKTPSDWSVIAGARFSPNGSKIAYWVAKYYGNYGNLFLTDVATGRTTQLTRLKADTELWDVAASVGGGPIFSPDGRTVFFSLPGGDDLNPAGELWSVPASGGRATLVHGDPMVPQLSPNGQMTVELRRRIEGDGFSGYRELWVSNVDGTNARRLATGLLAVPITAWSPDGNRIFYVDAAQGRQGSYVVDVTTGETSRVLDEIYPIEWVDDQTWLVLVPDSSAPVRLLP
jgi:WD40-like Beta Propeller Repeat